MRRRGYDGGGRWENGQEREGTNQRVQREALTLRVKGRKVTSGMAWWDISVILALGRLKIRKLKPAWATQ